MVDSWKAGDRYLSGIVMDIVFDPETGEDIISPTLIICDSMGNVDAVLNVNFVHAVLLAAMERKEILVTNELLRKLIPMPSHEDETDEPPLDVDKESEFPVDKQILDIARDIMSGKKNGDDKPDDSDGDDKPPRPKRKKSK